MGRTFLPHQLAIATLATVAVFAVPNPFAAKKPRELALDAGSKEEEDFIKNYLEKHTSDAKTA